MNEADALIDSIRSASLADAGPAPRFRRAGSFVFVSGVAAGARGLEGIRAQTTACIEALRDLLEEAGGGLENLVEVTTYLARMTDFAGYNEADSKYFTVDGPARTTVSVDRLAGSGALIELRGVAYIAESSNANA